MKKLLLLITGLLLLFSVEGQILRYSNYTTPVPPEEDTTNYYSVYKAIYDEMTTPPGHDTAHFQSAMVYSLDTLDFEGGSSVWDRMDCFYVFATRAAADVYMNWVNPGVYDITDPLTTNPTFTVYSGITGVVDDSDFLSTNYNAFTDATNFLYNSATVATYNRSGNATDNNVSIGVVNGNRIRLMPRMDGNMSTYMNGSGITTTANATLQGLSMTTRNANVTTNYQNGSSLGNGLTTGTDIPDGDIYVLAYNNAGSPNYYFEGEISIVFIMNGVTAGEAAAINTIIETYMDALGKGVQ